MSAGQAPPVSPAVRFTTVAAVVVVALVALAVSFSHMYTVASRAGEAWRSWLIPASVDGLMVAASMVLLVRRRGGLGGGWLAWTALLAGVGASLACNVAAAEATATARLLAAWPPLAFAAAFELLLQQRRTGPPPGVGTPQPVTARVSGSPARPAAPPSGPVRPIVPLVPPPPGVPDPSGPAPALRSGPVTRNGPAPSQTGTPRTDAQLSEAVRELAGRTGSIPSQYQVKQALGVGSGRAARLLAGLGTTPGADPASNGAARKEGTR